MIAAAFAIVASLIFEKKVPPMLLFSTILIFTITIVSKDSYITSEQNIHKSEGPDDMPAHIKSSLTQTNLSIPIENFEIALGTWQGVYLFEHRKSSHTRIIKMHLIG